MTTFYYYYQRNQYSRVFPFVLMFIDALVIYCLFHFLESRFLFSNLPGMRWMISITYILAWIIATLLSLGYFVENLNSYIKIFKSFGRALIIYGLILAVLYMPSLQQSESLVATFQLYLISFVSVFMVRLTLYKIYRLYRSHPSNRKNTVIIGYNDKSKKLFEHFSKRTDSQNRVLGIFDDNVPDDFDLPSLYFIEGLKNVENFCLKNDIKEIYVSLNLDEHAEFIDQLTSFVDKNFIYLGFITNADKFELDSKVEAKIFDNGKVPVVSYRRMPLRYQANIALKRLFDMVFSSMVLAITGITLFPIIAILIKLTSKGPVFYSQLRPGFNNKPFKCYKFRSMYVNQNGEQQARRGDDRITPIGRILRKTSLDELPQFFNVLTGDMSVVGPRPNLISQFEEYGDVISDYCVRHSIYPGITGYAQVNGFRGSTNSFDDMQKRVEHDIWYLQNWTLETDLKIIFDTVRNIFKGDENAY